MAYYLRYRIPSGGAPSGCPDPLSQRRLADTADPWAGEADCIPYAEEEKEGKKEGRPQTGETGAGTEAGRKTPSAAASASRICSMV